MNAAETKAYFEGLAQKAGIPAEKIAGVLQALEDESVGKVVLDAFVPRPEFSKGLDGERAKAEQAIATWKNWYEKDAKPAYDANVQGVELLKKYKERFGDLDMTSDDKHAAAAASGLTREDFQKLLNEELAKRDTAYVGLTKTAVKVAQDYMNRFKKPLDVDGLEKFALEKGLPLDSAYKEFIAPEVESARNAEWEAKLKAAREEGARDALSKVRNPIDARPKDQPHMFWDRKEVPQGTTEQQQDRASREAFLTAWTEPAAAPQP